MNWSDAAWIGALVALVGAVGTAVGVMLKSLLDTWRGYRAERRVDTQYEDQKAKEGRDILIAAHTERIQNLETINAKREAEHILCLEKTAEQRVQIQWLEKMTAELQKRMEPNATK